MSKGDTPRPLSVPQETYASEWERIFGNRGDPYRDAVERLYETWKKHIYESAGDGRWTRTAPLPNSRFLVTADPFWRTTLRAIPVAMDAEIPPHEIHLVGDGERAILDLRDGTVTHVRT